MDLASLRPPLSQPGKEALLPRQLLPFPGKEAFLPRQGLSLLEKLAPLQQLLSFQGKEAIPPRLFLSLHWGKETAHLIPSGPPR